MENNIKKLNVTKNDMRILDTIRQLNATNSLRSVPVNTLVSKTNLSHTKVRSTVTLLLQENFIEEGLMQKNAKTYFITDKGIETICNLLSNDIAYKTKEDEEKTK